MKTWISILFILGSTLLSAQNKSETYFNSLSEDFLRSALHKEDTKPYRAELARTPLDTLVKYLNSDTKRIAFWVNVYNAYIQHILQQIPESYQKKGKFFSGKQIPLFKTQISFDQIEHGILRKNQFKYGFGNIKRWFPPQFVRELQVDKRDYRVHFVLNCGAKSCPTTLLLKPETLESQLQSATSSYLEKTSKYEPEKNIVHVTPLMMWFRGDFGNKKGVMKLLQDEGLIPLNSKPKMEKIPYDWTIDLTNFSIE